MTGQRSPQLRIEYLEDRTVPATLPPGFSERLVADGLMLPTAMTLVPDGRIFVAESIGDLHVIRDGVLLPEPLLQLDVVPFNERGLLGVTVPPDFIDNPFVYVYYTAPGQNGGREFNRVSRFLVEGDRVVPNSEEVLLDLDPLGEDTRHNGGAMHFGADGKLYVAVGDGTIPSNSQNLGTLKGKILRLNPDGSIPPDNPFVDQVSGKSRAIWALGLRNPFTFAFQPFTGRMFINDVGEMSFDEINDGLAGANYGWPESEGPTSDPRFQTPLFAIPHDRSAGMGFAIAGGTFYNPQEVQFPEEFVGRYFFANFVLGRIRVFNPATGEAPDFATDLEAPVDLRVAPDGSLFYLQRGNGVETGAIYQITTTAAVVPEIIRQPRDTLVSVGQSAMFSIEATGSNPLHYQWQRNGVDIPGATSSAFTLPDAGLVDDSDRFSVVVANASGSVTSREAILSVTTDLPPEVTIELPSTSARFIAGETIAFRGMAIDPETGELPADSLTWTVEYITAGASRVEGPPITGTRSGEFTIPPRTPFLGTDVAYRFTLTAVDPLGLQTTVSRDLSPAISTFTVTSDFSGVLRVDGAKVPTPSSFDGVVGVIRSVEAKPVTVIEGQRFFFDRWSDGGARTHEFATPATETTLRALYEPGPSVGQDEVSRIAVGPGPGGGPLIARFDSNFETPFQMFAFEPGSFSGGVRTASADLTGDGVADLIAGTGPGISTLVRIYDGVTHALIRSITPFEPTFTGGVLLSAGDVTGDRIADLVITPDNRGGPRVRIFDGPTGTPIADFLGIDDPNFRGGVRTALGDLTGDLIADLIVAAGFGGGPRVAGYHGVSLVTTPTKLFGDFFVFDRRLRNGATVSAGDTNGDGFADLVAGGGPGGGPRVFILSGRDLVRDGRRVQIGNFFAGDENDRGGISVTVKSLDGDEFADVVTGSGPGTMPRVTAYMGAEVPIDGLPPVLDEATVFDDDFRGGVFVG